MSTFPSGTVTFLFTDIEGSTKLARAHPKSWESARARHHEILREAIEENSGYIFQIVGDAFCATFHKAGDALKAATKAQHNLQNEAWGDVTIRVRMGIHTGEGELQEDGQYQGYLALSLVQRIMSAGNGNQVLLSGATEHLLRGQLSEGVNLLDMGRHNFKDVPQAVRIFQVNATDLQRDFPPLRTFNIRPNNLPVQLTSFVGREKERGEIKQSLLTHRLVSLTGIGGTGKTRLALKVAEDTLNEFPDGVWFVELAPITNPDFITQVILSAMGLSEPQDITALQLLLDYLRGKKVLLILDNCEHLIKACAKEVDTLLNNARDLKLLTTSREALGIQGELIWQIPSLALPDTMELADIEQLKQFEAVQLFIDRVTLVQPYFVLKNENASAVTEICLRLDGIPLAIELAAVRVKALNIEDIAKRLDDRFRLLTGGSRTALERHQTLRATIDWSYNLLDGDEKILFRKLSVFSGGWTLEAAEQICVGHNDILFEDVLDLMTHLVDKSLVITDGSRYRMLETVRQYARDKLYESEDGETLRTAHLEYFLKLAEEANPKLESAERPTRMKQLHAEHDNFRVALNWSLSQANDFGIEKCLRLASALRRFWHFSGYSHEGRSWLEKTLAMPSSKKLISTTIHAQGLYATGYLAWSHGDISAARSYLEDSAELYRKIGPSNRRDLAATLTMLAATSQGNDPKKACSLIEESVAMCRALGSSAMYELAQALFWKGHIYMVQRDNIVARNSAEESRSIYQQIGDVYEVAAPVSTLGHISRQEGDFTSARTYYLESFKMFDESQDKWGIAITLQFLGDVEQALGDYSSAKLNYEKSLILWQEIGYRPSALDHLDLGITALFQEDTELAASFLVKSLTMLQKSEDKVSIMLSLSALSNLAAVQGQPVRAMRLLGAARAIEETIDSFESIDIIDRNNYRRLVTEVQSQVDEAGFDTALAECRKMTQAQAIEYALKLSLE